MTPANIIRNLMPASAILGAMLLGGCVTGGYETFQYHEIHEIPQGPGLVTDQEDYTVFSRDLGGLGGGSAQSTQPAPVPTVSTSGGITETSTPE